MRTRICLVSGAFVAALLPLVASGPAAHAAIAPVSSQLIAISDTHSLVVGQDGQVYGAGQNAHGELGGAGVHQDLGALPVLPGGRQATAVAAGHFFSVALAGPKA